MEVVGQGACPARFRATTPGREIRSLMAGVRASVADTVLVARARDALAAGPLEVTELVERILALPGAPRRVAERLASAMLGSYPEFVSDATGRWSLVDAPEGETRASGLDLGSMRFAVVDVETTGNSARLGDRITEIAIVPVDVGGVGQPFVTLINPLRPIAPAVVALTSITQEMVAKAPAFGEVAETVAERLCGRVFVAHNVRFDWQFVCGEVERSSGTRLSGETLCTVRMMKALLPQLRRRNLDSLARYFGIEIVNRHRAGDDALATARAFARMLSIAQDQGVTTLPALRRKMERQRGRPKKRRRAMPQSMEFDPGI